MLISGIDKVALNISQCGKLVALIFNLKKQDYMWNIVVPYISCLIGLSEGNLSSFKWIVVEEVNL